MTQPELCLRTDSFNHAIESFTAHGYGAKMKSYQPPTTSVFDAMIGGLDAECETSPEASELERIHHEWESLHISSQDNLVLFEDPSFQLPDRASGAEAVKDLVSPMSHSSGHLLIPVSLAKSMTL